MASLYEVLDAVRQADHPVSVEHLARKLNIDPGALQAMLAFWVTKGRLRMIGPADGTLCSVTGCHTCSSAGPLSCPMIVHEPVRYALVNSDDPH
jgi:hypothetical protein